MAGGSFLRATSESLKVCSFFCRSDQQLEVMDTGWQLSNQVLNYFKEKNAVLIFPLTPALSPWDCFRSYISGLKNSDLEICFFLRAVKSRMGILMVVLLLLCRAQSRAELLTCFFFSLTTNSSKSPPCPSGVCTDLLHDQLVHGWLCLSYVT